MAVTVEYIGNKKGYKYKGHSFPCKMREDTARALIARNPKTFKCDELVAEADIDGGDFQGIDEENTESDDTNDDSKEE